MAPPREKNVKLGEMFCFFTLHVDNRKANWSKQKNFDSYFLIELFILSVANLDSYRLTKSADVI